MNERHPEGTTWLGRKDGESLRLPSEAAAQDVLAAIERHDPEGVARGDYFLDVNRAEDDGDDTRKWKIEHAPDCPVTRCRADLLRELAADPGNVYLLGAVPEYDEGGDQEVELCECGLYPLPASAASRDPEYQRGVTDTRDAQQAGPPGSAEREQAYREMEQRWDREGFDG